MTLSLGNRGRDKVPSVVVVLTDGRVAQRNELIANVGKLESHGIRLVWVPMVQNNDAQSAKKVVHDLAPFASKPARLNVLPVSSFDKTEAQNIVSVICSSVKAGNTTNTTEAALQQTTTSFLDLRIP